MSIDLMPGFGAFTQSFVATTWNPSDKAADITLSNGDKTVTVSTGPAGGGSVRSTTAKSSGKWHFEVVFTTAGLLGVGFANSSESLLVTDYTGKTLDGQAYYSDTGNVVRNAGTVTTLETFTSGDVIAVEVDFDAELVWYVKNAGNWNNSGTASPATGTEGISFSALNVGPYYIMTTEFGNGEYTLRVTSGEFTRAVSSGFTPWN